MKKIIIILLTVIASINSYANSKEPLWTSRYRQSGQGYCIENGQYSQTSFPDKIVTVKVYDDYITITDQGATLKYDYHHAVGYGTKVYRRVNWGQTIQYYVLLDRTMYLDSFSSQFPGITMRYSMEALD